MLYDGMNAAVASGARGSNGATSTAASGSAATGAAAGAGADFFFLVALFLDLFIEADAATPMQQHNNASNRTHAMMGMYEPAEPESTEPELPWEPEESPEVKEATEPEVRDIKEPEESVPLEPDEESHGVTVVDGATVITSLALTSGAGSPTLMATGSS